MPQNNTKTAIITGASRGIGAAVTERLARDGFNVIVNYSGDAGPADLLVAKIESAGGRARSMQADVADRDRVKRMFDDAEAAFGSINVLINNAGIMPLAEIADMDDATFDRILAVNLKGVFNTLREAAKRLRRGGKIVNLSSSVVGLYPPTYAAYAATKAGVEALTHVLSKELRGRDITVNAIAPGPTATDLFMQGKSKELVDTIAAQNPLGRLGTPEDIARVIAFLVGDEGGWINSQVLRANGGMI
jgi:3-oxoacyl-[acyl-carrier protein] reductase